MVHLTAQTINMNVNHICRRVNLHPPNVIQDHRARHHAAGIPAKIFQERKFLRRKLKQPVTAPGLMTHQIKLQVCGLQPRWLVLRCGRPTQYVSKSREQFR